MRLNSILVCAGHHMSLHPQWQGEKRARKIGVRVHFSPNSTLTPISLDPDFFITEIQSGPVSFPADRVMGDSRA